MKAHGIVTTPTARMRFSALLREALREAWAQKIPSLLVLLVVAATCATAIGVLGQGAAQQRDMTAAIESAGGRLLTITDTKAQGGINPATMSMIRHMTGVESAVALAAPIDVVNTRIMGTPRVPAWQVDDPRVIATPVLGNQNAAGQAGVSATTLATLRMVTSSGSVSSTDGTTHFDVTSTVCFRPAFTDLAEGVIVQAGQDTTYRQVRIVVTSIGALSSVQDAVLGLVSSSDPTAIVVDTPAALVSASALFSTQAVNANRTTLLLILAAGGFFSALVTLTDVLLHRKQMGRRRALGLSRSGLTILTTIRMACPAVLGALTGSVAALAVSAVALHVSVPWDYTLAIAILALTTACLAALLPATWASRRDPVSVLRTP